MTKSDQVSATPRAASPVAQEQPRPAAVLMRSDRPDERPRPLPDLGRGRCRNRRVLGATELSDTGVVRLFAGHHYAGSRNTPERFRPSAFIWYTAASASEKRFQKEFGTSPVAVPILTVTASRGLRSDQG